jgi:hypothetical protein
VAVLAYNFYQHPQLVAEKKVGGNIGCSTSSVLGCEKMAASSSAKGRKATDNLATKVHPSSSSSSPFPHLVTLNSQTNCRSMHITMCIPEINRMCRK